MADALAAVRRLVAFHAGPGGPPLGPLLAAAVPAVDALRSQTARSAMLLLQVRLQGLRVWPKPKSCWLRRRTRSAMLLLQARLAGRYCAVTTPCLKQRSPLP